MFSMMCTTITFPHSRHNVKVDGFLKNSWLPAQHTFIFPYAIINSKCMVSVLFYLFSDNNIWPLKLE